MHQRHQPQILPRRLSNVLRRALDAKRRVLVGYDVIFVFRVDGLVLWRDVDFVVGELVLAKVFKEVGVAGAVHVHVRVGRVFVLDGKMG